MKDFWVTAQRLGLGEHDDVNIQIEDGRVTRGVGRLSDKGFRERLLFYQNAPAQWTGGLSPDWAAGVLKKLSESTERKYRFTQRFSSLDVAVAVWSESPFGAPR